MVFDLIGGGAYSFGMAEKVGDDWSWSCDVPVGTTLANAGQKYECECVESVH